MSGDGRSFEQGKRQRARTQREPAGGGDNGVSVMDAPSPAVSEHNPMATHLLLERLEKQRQANGGFLVPPPMPLDQLARAIKDYPIAPMPGTAVIPNAEFEATEQWFEDIYEAGGASTDIFAAWNAWTETASPLARHQMRAGLLDSLLRRSRTRDARRSEALEREAGPHRQLEYIWRMKNDAEQRVARLKEDLAMAEKDLQRHTASERAHLENYPYLKPSEAA